MPLGGVVLACSAFVICLAAFVLAAAMRRQRRRPRSLGSTLSTWLCCGQRGVTMEAQLSRPIDLAAPRPRFKVEQPRQRRNGYSWISSMRHAEKTKLRGKKAGQRIG